MREIKFRARLNDNTTIYFTLRDLANPHPFFSIRELLIPWLRAGNIPDEYTGLKDKNGREIYKGDILRFEGMGLIEYEIGEVMWSRLETWGAHEPDPDCWNVVGYYKTKGSQHLSEVNRPVYDNEGEVIGNIYENPKLLENKK